MVNVNDTPDLSVIVIVYNDEQRLPRAVRSVLEQTKSDIEIIIVDDASTDGSLRVAGELAAEHPGRIRVLGLDRNSGGGGRPRNHGVAIARGRYVMFLDSDDVLRRHACQTMYSTAVETGADLVSGLCVQVITKPHRTVEAPWFPRLYRTRRELASLGEDPGLLYDTLSTNKCYRRDFLVSAGLRFPEGVPHEDLYFATCAYLAAKKIVLTPHRIYDWIVVPRAENLSVSSRRNEIRHFADRLVIHRQIDEALAVHGDEELKLAKDVKFINHDIRLYVAEYALRDEEYQREFRKIAGEYLSGLDPRAIDRCHRDKALAAYLIMKDDHEGLSSVSDYLGARGALTADLVQHEGRIYWSDRHLDDPDGRRFLDVTARGFHSRPVNRIRLLARMSSFRQTGETLTIEGRISNPLGRIRLGADTSAHLEFRARRSGRRFEVPVRVHAQGPRLGWTSSFSLAGRRLAVSPLDGLWNVDLVIQDGPTRIRSRICDDPEVRADVEIDLRPYSGALPGYRMVPFETFPTRRCRGGYLAFQMKAVTVPARGLRSGARRAAAVSPVRPVRNLWRQMSTGTSKWWNSRKTKAFVCRHVFSRMPVRAGTAVFESHLGKQYSDSPRAIYEYLRDNGGGIRPVWSYAVRPEGFPSEAKLVKRDSWAYYRALSRAQYWVDNQGFPDVAPKRAGTTYIQTWHGSAFKRMGLHEPRIMLGTEAARENLRRSVSRYDAFLVRSAHDERTLVRGLGVEAELLRVGYPRNDALVQGGDPEKLDRLRAELGLTDGRRAVLYAPTFKQTAGGRPRAFSMPFDSDRFLEELGDRYVLLVRAHYLNRGSGVASPCGTIRDVSGVDDITSLLLVSDVLVTDYSSVMFDFALLDRPMVFHAPDLDSYVGRLRGSYFSLAEHAPGPLTRDEDGLLAALSDLDALTHEHRARRREFIERFGEYDTGTAAKAVADRFFLRGTRRG